MSTNIARSNLSLALFWSPIYPSKLFFFSAARVSRSLLFRLFATKSLACDEPASSYLFKNRKAISLGCNTNSRLHFAGLVQSDKHMLKSILCAACTLYTEQPRWLNHQSTQSIRKRNKFWPTCPESATTRGGCAFVIINFDFWTAVTIDFRSLTQPDHQ